MAKTRAELALWAFYQVNPEHFVYTGNMPDPTTDLSAALSLWSDSTDWALRRVGDHFCFSFPKKVQLWEGDWSERNVVGEENLPLLIVACRFESVTGERFELEEG